MGRERSGSWSRRTVSFGGRESLTFDVTPVSSGSFVGTPQRPMQQFRSTSSVPAPMIATISTSSPVLAHPATVSTVQASPIHSGIPQNVLMASPDAQNRTYKTDAGTSGWSLADGSDGLSVEDRGG